MCVILHVICVCMCTYIVCLCYVHLYICVAYVYLFSYVYTLCACVYICICMYCVYMCISRAYSLRETEALHPFTNISQPSHPQPRNEVVWNMFSCAWLSSLSIVSRGPLCHSKSVSRCVSTTFLYPHMGRW